jgi:hypothetical protein
MRYYTFHIDDSGAIKDIDERKSNGESITLCKMYDDPEFNKLNDILHVSGNQLIINEKAFSIFKESNIIPYNLRSAKVLRKEKKLRFLKMYRSYNYYELTFLDNHATECYEWIDFEKSEIFAISNLKGKFKIYSHQETLDLIKLNRLNLKESHSFEAIKIVFGKNFNTKIDLFNIRLYSSGNYISERLKNKLINAGISDVDFAYGKEKLGEMWKPLFPVIEFDNNL